MANIINGTDTGSGGLITTGDSSDELQLQTAETTALTIDSSQNVGVGTTTPDKKLHVVGDDGVTAFSSYGARDFLVVENNQNTNIQIVSNSANSGNILFSDEAASGRGVITYDHSSDDMVFKSAATEAARFTSAGNLKFPNGQGIDFSASAGGGASSSILDDYEEGTWTPVLADASTGGNTGSASISHATYVKIGKLVTIQATLTNIVTTGMTSANPLFVRDLPFVSASNNNCPGSVLLDNVALQGSRTYAISYCGLSDTWITFSAIGTATIDTSIDIGDLTSGVSDIIFAITYEV